MDHSFLWSLEQRLWLEGASAYEELLHPNCLMVFPGVGLMSADDVLESLKGAPRWRSVEMSSRRTNALGDDAALLAYKAEALRDEAARYVCFCSSTYVQEDGRWRIVHHQQTAAG